MNLKVLASSSCNWCITTLVIPLCLFLVWLYVGLHDIDVTKATKEELSKLDIKFTEQLTRNTSAVEGLTTSISKLEDAITKLKE